MKAVYWVVIAVVVLIALTGVLFVGGLWWYLAGPSNSGINCVSKSNAFPVASSYYIGDEGISLKNGSGKEAKVLSAKGSGDFSCFYELPAADSNAYYSCQSDKVAVAANDNFRITGIMVMPAVKSGTFESGTLTVGIEIEGQKTDFEVVCTKS